MIKEGNFNWGKTVEITSGRANFQQGLTATCKDLAKAQPKAREDFGLAHESV